MRLIILLLIAVSNVTLWWCVYVVWLWWTWFCQLLMDHVCWYRTIMIEKILWQYIFTFLFWCSCIEMTIWLMCCWSLWYKFWSNYVLWCNDYFFFFIKLLFLFLLCIGVFMFGWWCYWCRWYFVMGFLTTSFK